jgi:hypothetical protein
LHHTNTDISNTPKQPNNTTSNSSSSGVVVPPEVWEQMQRLLSTFGPSNAINASQALIMPQLAPSVDLLAKNKTSLALSPFVPQLADNKLTSSQSISLSNPSSDEEDSTCLNLAPPVEDLQSLVKNDSHTLKNLLTNNQSVVDLTADPIGKTITVNGVISDIKHDNFATGCQYPSFSECIFFVQLIFQELTTSIIFRNFGFPTFCSVQLNGHLAQLLSKMGQRKWIFSC